MARYKFYIVLYCIVDVSKTKMALLMKGKIKDMVGVVPSNVTHRGKLHAVFFKYLLPVSDDAYCCFLSFFLFFMGKGFCVFIGPSLPRS